MNNGQNFSSQRVIVAFICLLGLISACQPIGPTSLPSTVSSLAPSSTVTRSIVLPVPSPNSILSPIELPTELGNPRKELIAMLQRIHQGAYTEAYRTWDIPPDPSVEQFRARFTNIIQITPTLQIVSFGAATGNLIVQIDTHLAIQSADGAVAAQTGCIVMHRSNPRNDDAPINEAWRIDSALTSVALFALSDEKSRIASIATLCTRP